MGKKSSVFLRCLICAIVVIGAIGSKTVQAESVGGVTRAETPTDASKGGTKWTKKFNTASLGYNSTPVITEEAIYIVNGNQLYQLNLQGKILCQLTLCSGMNSVCYMEWDGKNLYIPLAGGRIECVDTKAWNRIWVSEAMGGQSLSHVLLYQGTVSAGTVEMQAGGKTKGVYYCLNAQDGTLLWKYESNDRQGGYYWSGGFGRADALYFTGDHGKLIKHAIYEDCIYGEKELSFQGKIRSDFVYDSTEDVYYTMSNQGQLCCLAWEEDNAMPVVTKYVLYPDGKAVNCTGTPTVLDTTLYVGGMVDGKGFVCVWDKVKKNIRYTVYTGVGCEVKATPLVSTAHKDTWYVYYTCNAFPGGIYFFQDTSGQTSGNQQSLYIPYTAKQYCMSGIVSGADGTLYYSNDSGTLFAVAEVTHSSDVVVTPVPTKKPGSSQASGAGTPGGNEASVKKPSKPTSVKKKKTKKGYVITWTKGKNASKTWIYGKVGKGKWKKMAVTTKKRYVLSKKKLKSYGTKTVKIRMRSGRKYKGKWVYSSYTGSIRIK